MTNEDRQKAIGGSLVLGGAVFLFLIIFFSKFIVSLQPTGDLVAVLFFLIIVGLVFYFPKLIYDAGDPIQPPAGGGGGQSNAGQSQTTNPVAPTQAPAPSTMRVAVLIIVSVFALLALKNGWNQTEIPELDSHWMWLLGVALGAKAAQSFAENGLFKKP